MNPPNNRRDELVREADLVRARLLHTVEQLDHRRHEVLDLQSQLKRHLRQFVVVGGVLAAATAGAVAVTVHRITTASARRRRNRWRLVRTAWQRPERILRGGGARPFWAELARGILVSAISTALAPHGRRAAVSLGERATAHARRLAGALASADAPKTPRV